MDQLDLIVIVGAAVAGFVQGLSGFAFGLVAMAFWVWALDPHLAGPLVIFGGLIGQLLLLGTIRQTFTLKRCGPIISGGFVGIPIGVALLSSIDPNVFKLFIGIVLLVACPLLLFSQRMPRIAGGGGVADAGAGIVGGIMGGLGGLPGPAPTLWTTLRGWGRDDSRAVIQSFNLAMQAFALTAYAISGLLSVDMLRYFALVVPAMLIPNIIGNRMYAKLGDDSFRRIVLVLLTLSGFAITLGAI